MPALVRLYFSPLTPELLPKVIPEPTLSSASEVSFHTIQTFPERSYGYVNLPTMEADKIKKKLNGTILKGSKVKVEEARTKKHVRNVSESGAPETDGDKGRRLRKSDRKRKREDGVLSGFELPEDRKVKRGWTEPAKKSKEKRVKKVEKGVLEKDRKKKVQESLYTDKPECLFKTKLPSNAPNGSVKDAKGGKKSKRAKNDKETVVHEFENTIKHPTFLRAGSVENGKTMVKEFDETKGWLDEDGKIVEKAPTRTAKSSKRVKAATSRGNSGSTNPVIETTEEQPQSPPESPAPLDDETSSSGSPSAEETDTDSAPRQGSDSRESSSKPIPTLELSQSSPATAEPHPLESLFKKPKVPSQGKDRDSHKPDLEVKVPFSFFDSNNGEDDGEDGETGSAKATVEPSSKKAKARSLPNLSIPQTPFTQRDRHWRSQRSAAPTPDTAAPGRTGFGNIWNRDDMEDDINEDDEEEGNNEDDNRSNSAPAPTPSGKQKAKEDRKEEKPESDFAKWFWENRGDTNRAWKKRRREAGKEKRQRENKRKAKASL